MCLGELHYIDLTGDPEHADVGLSDDGSLRTLIVADDGVGLPAMPSTQPGSLGTRIIVALAPQIGGIGTSGCPPRREGLPALAAPGAAEDRRPRVDTSNLGRTAEASGGAHLRDPRRGHETLGLPGLRRRMADALADEWHG